MNIVMSWCAVTLSAIKSIGRGASRSRQDLMHKILLAVRDVARRGVKISLMWVPAHVGILANEKSEGESIVWREVMLQWQRHWKLESKGRHLFSVSSRVTESVDVCRSRGWKRRKEEVNIIKLRIGHTFLSSTLHHDGEYC